MQLFKLQGFLGNLTSDMCYQVTWSTLDESDSLRQRVSVRMRRSYGERVAPFRERFPSSTWPHGAFVNGVIRNAITVV